MMLVIYGPTATGKTDLAIKLAKKYHKATSMFFLGRKYSYPVAMEGAL